MQAATGFSERPSRQAATLAWLVIDIPHNSNVNGLPATVKQQYIAPSTTAVAVPTYQPARVYCCSIGEQSDFLVGGRTRWDWLLYEHHENSTASSETKKKCRGRSLRIQIPDGSNRFRWRSTVYFTTVIIRSQQSHPREVRGVLARPTNRHLVYGNELVRPSWLRVHNYSMTNARRLVLLVTRSSTGRTPGDGIQDARRTF